MAVVFSSNGAQIIEQLLAASETVTQTRPDELDREYEIEETCNFITRNQFKKIALQFPDELLADSAAVAFRVEQATGSKTYILGDTSYGSCCVDEVAAEHVGADCIIHYGRACLSPSRRLPVMYVFGQRPLDVKQCAASFRQLYPDTQSRVVVLCDVVYSYVLDDLRNILHPEYKHVVFSSICPDRTSFISCYQSEGPSQEKNEKSQCRDSPKSQKLICRFGRQIATEENYHIDDYGMFYLGPESLTLTNFMMSWNKCTFCTFNPITGTGRQDSLNVNKALMKRYYLIERARDAQVVGILVGTLGVADYLSVIDHLKELIRKAGKKSYTFVMGRLNAAKLANFLEVDIYVLVACPENSLLDSSEFYRPVVTVFEMELACNKAREWTGEYITDFGDLLPGACSHVPIPAENPEDDGNYDVSLITGHLRSTHLPQAQPQNDSSCTAVAPRNEMLTVAEPHCSASHLASRSWKGLEQKLGETPVTKAVEGRRGIAIAYEDEVNS
ncbi:2-(3-amino-3-carboxypropyl)histidine synthase subunit 2 isoform X1 [Protopterus annectens]|uniref:2-(3-amino-3-carboxypropyl)histidine synthase subunit 2 isoform X1 n=1 Tax=Protopterus annectens TaxID=7888 RepID=UPI001CFB242F|nr:2-(3-amino-3-carboxypropyl)histidine synthase subunit 2 isoform X1 [Protopterus annectens]